LQIILPWIISRYTAGPKPLNVFLKAYPIRLAFGVVFMFLLRWTKHLNDASSSGLPFYYFIVITVIYGMHQVCVNSIYVALMAFHSMKSDPAIGGTYMTLLNTLTNLGGNWPATLSLYAVEWFDYKDCEVLDKSGKCTTVADGYYFESSICIAIGFIWLYGFGKSRIEKLQKLPSSAWKCSPHS
jgi:PAT family acetyl-CoA transporter-like MFS transporter 1